MLGESYYALPSSIHEFIVVPDSAGIDEKAMKEMVREANTHVVEAKDVLSDKVLHFDKGRMGPDALEESREKDIDEREER